MKAKRDNPIVGKVGKYIIRKVNTIRMQLGDIEFTRAAEAATSLDMSIPKIIALQGKPCTHCGHCNIDIQVPKGILLTKGMEKERESNG